jgi:hypothetical protein
VHAPGFNHGVSGVRNAEAPFVVCLRSCGYAVWRIPVEFDRRSPLRASRGVELVGEVRERLQRIIVDAASDLGCEVLAFEVMSDHVRVLIWVDP